MSTLRMTSDLRRQLILSAAKRCFARNGFAGTTTKSVAAAASISEGLLFKHFPSKAALYAEILAEECEADPDFAHLLGQEPSTATLVELVKGMVGHFMEVSDGSDQEEAQRLRLMTTSHLDDGEFARLLYDKIGGLIGPVFRASIESAVAAGDKSHKRPVRLVRWFIVVGTLLALLVGGLVWFNYFRGKMIAQFFANNKPPPVSVNVAAAKSETIPNLLTAVGDLAAVHQVNVT